MLLNGGSSMPVRLAARHYNLAQSRCRFQLRLYLSMFRHVAHSHAACWTSCVFALQSFVHTRWYLARNVFYRMNNSDF